MTELALPREMIEAVISTADHHRSLKYQNGVRVRAGLRPSNHKLPAASFL